MFFLLALIANQNDDWSPRFILGGTLWHFLSCLKKCPVRLRVIEMKKLPISASTLTSIVNENCYYVDKTHFVKRN
jgi:hypothetical protein